MKFYESGDNRKPVIFLFPGTCCQYSSFDHVLDGLHSYFYTVAVSYDGFDSNEKTEFYSMEDECEKIEQEIRTKYGGRIKAAYGCSLGGSFVSLLIQRKRIHIDYGIIGSSDMDEAGNLVAKIQASMVVPFMYKMIHTGALPKFMQKKLNKTDGAKKELYNGFLNMFGIGKGGSPWITKQSIYNQFYSDLVTKVQHGIDVPGTTIHVFYATKGSGRRQTMKEKVNVTGVPETMVQTLYARAKETRKKNAKINDEIAVELVKKLDYDFSKADKDNAMTYGVIARTIVLDRMVRKYLEKHENTVVVNIACGLDTRCYRMKGKYLRWYNVDLPETMKIRSQFLTETDPVYQIAKSAMDDSYIDDIDYHGKNILVIIEGLTMYLYEKDIRKMFSIIDKSFQKVTVMVETMSPFVVKHMKEKSIEGSNAKFTWGVKNRKELQRIIPAFSVRQEVSLVEGMKELMPVYYVIGKIPAVRNISNKIIVLEKHS